MSSTMDPDTVLLNTLHQDLPDPDVLLHAQVILELDKFEPFPKLPIELRLLIWKMTFKPRKIRVALVCESLRYSWDRGVVGLESRTRAPSVLHVSQESRLVGLQHYFALLRDHQRTHCVIYVNPEIDTVALYQGRKDNWLSSHHYLPARL
ncbi:uncharacterized protein PAC_10074 [Phialocephala subalpina]|uniref:2EXR domain-containing protein n=1 Tax=Phialocephala subalpina TaxID=576137 RepID=A0A1L7X585_9HELO|nr:uncharacterized protein PAC_10074 [Phialocephala subalpina]